MRKLMIILLIAVISIIIVTYVVTEKSGDYEDSWKSTPYVVSEFTSGTVSVENIKTTNADGTGGHLNVDLEKTTEDIIDKVGEKNYDAIVRYLGDNREEQKQYLSMLVKASNITKYPDLREKDKIGTKTEEFELQGCIQVKRALSTTDGVTGSKDDQVLEYMEYSKFMQLIDANDEKALNYFTVKSSENKSKDEDTVMNIVVATWIKNTVEVTSNDDRVETGTIKDEYIISASSFAYQNITDNFGMPFDLLWGLLCTSKDKDFVYDVAQLVLDSKIVITVQDNLYTTIETNTYDYDNQKIREQTVYVNWSNRSETERGNDNKLFTEEEVTKYETTTVSTSKINVIHCDITYADTWLLTYRNSYKNDIKGLEVTSDETFNKDNLEELEDIINQTAGYSWKYPNYSQAFLEEKVNEMDESKNWVKDKRDSVQTASVNRQDVINYLLGLARNYNDAFYNAVKGSQNNIAGIIMGDNYEYNRQRFVSLARGIAKTALGTIMDNTHSWYITELNDEVVLEISQVDRNEFDNTINRQEHVVLKESSNRYMQGTPVVKEKLNKTAYYSTIGLEWTKSWENNSLRKYFIGEIGYSDYYVKNYLSEDGLYYLCHSDHYKGRICDRNYAYGLMTTVNVDNDPNNWNIEVCRKIFAGLHDLDDIYATGYTNEEIVEELKEEYSATADVSSEPSRISCEIIDKAIIETYIEIRENLSSYIRSAQQQYGGQGETIFTEAQLNAMARMFYAGWGNGIEEVKLIYKNMLNNKIDDCKEYLTSFDSRMEEALWQAFKYGRYFARYDTGPIEENAEELDPNEWEDGEIKAFGSFIAFLNHSKTAKRNILGSPDWLIQIIEQSPEAADMENTIKYLLNVASGKEIFEVDKVDWVNKFKSLSSYSFTPISNFNVNTLKSVEDIVVGKNDEFQKKQLKDGITKKYQGQTLLNINKYLDSFIEMQNRYHVNAVFAISVAVVETKAGTDWGEIDQSTNNWFGLREKDESNQLVYKKYDSVEDSIFDFGKVISAYFREGKYTVKEIGELYCDEDWANAVAREMTKTFIASGVNLISQFTFGIDLYNPDGSVNEEAIEELAQAFTDNIGVPRYARGISSSDVANVNAHGWNYFSNTTNSTNTSNCLETYQCTWWANGRASMYLDMMGICKMYPTQLGNAKDYINNNSWFNWGKDPKPNSILVRTTGECGHVLYVEAVDYINKVIYVSHAGSGTYWNGITCYSFYEAETGYAGFIYLDEPNVEF